jgi:ABC-type glycerol-3-phosphate transport system permease component
MSRTRRTRRATFALVSVHTLLLVLAAITIMPFAWLVCATVKRGEDLFQYSFLPWDGLSRLTLENFQQLFARQSFLPWFINSLFVTALTTVLVVALSSLGGFALAKYQFRFKRLLMFMMLSTMLLPGQVLLPSMYELMHKIGWLNTYLAIIVPGTVSVFGMFLFRQAMLGVPDELLHAGRVDGCSELRLWWDIALPCVRPMVGAFTLMSFLGNWNSFLWPQIVLQDDLKYTLPIGLASMNSVPEFQMNYGVLMAGTFVSILPVVLLFFVLQRDFIAGLTSGAVKG